MFTRPSDTVILRALTEDSALVADAVANATNKDIFNNGQTSKDWFSRRIKYQRTKNQKVGLLVVEELQVYDVETSSRARRLGARAVVQSIGLRLRDLPMGT